MGAIAFLFIVAIGGGAIAGVVLAIRAIYNGPSWEEIEKANLMQKRQLLREVEAEEALKDVRPGS